MLISLLQICCVMFGEISPSGKDYTVVKDDIYYNNVNGSLQVVDAEWIENLVIPDDVNGINVTSIAPSAFQNRIDIEYVLFGNYMTSIGQYAFANCSNLHKIDFSADRENDDRNIIIDQYAFSGALLDCDLVFPVTVTFNSNWFAKTKINSVKVLSTFQANNVCHFGECEQLQKVEFFNSGWLGNNMFEKCTSLKQVRVPDGITAISYRCFYNCSSLENVTNVTNKVDIVYEGAFYNTKIKAFDLSHVTKLYSGAFRNTLLETVSVSPDLVVYSGGSRNYPLSTAISLENVKRIDYPSLEKLMALKPAGGDSNVGGFDIYIDGELLTELKIPTTETSVGGLGAIKSLKKLIIPNSAREVNVGEKAFYGCLNLETVEIGAGSVVFDNKGSQFMNCSNLTSFSISGKNQCRTLPRNIFSGAGPLTNLSIPAITTLDSYCFENSQAISLDLTNVTSVGAYCFKKSALLKEIKLPNILTVSSGLFEGCSSLETLTLDNVTTQDERWGFNLGGCTSLKRLSMPKLQSVLVTVPASLEYAGFDSATVLIDLTANDESDDNLLNELYVPLVEKYNWSYSNSMLRCFKHLKKLSMPKLEVLNFQLPENIVSADFPSVTRISGVDYDTPCLEHLNIPNVVSIEWGFAANNRLTELKLDNLETITHPYTFSKSQCLKEVYLPKVKKMLGFSNSPLLEKIVVGDSCREISTSDLPSLKLLEAYGDIDVCSVQNSFTGVDSKMIFHGNVASMAPYMYNNNVKEVIFEGDFGKAQTQSFRNWKLESITFKGAVGSFDVNAFQEVNTLKSIKIGSLEAWLTATCKDAGCPIQGTDVDIYILEGDKETLLKDVVIPAGFGARQDAFIHSSLNSAIFLPAESEDEYSVIAKGAFHKCSQLKKVSIGEGITYIGPDAFSHSGVEEIIMPESVTGIGDGAFQVCHSLKNVTFSPNITYISTGALYNCIALERIIIPEGVTDMGYQVINGKARNIKFISLPSTLENLSRSFRATFYELSTDVVIYSWAENPPYAPFERFFNVEVHIPVGSLEKYQADQKWAEAKLIADLNAEHPVKVVENTIEIIIPQNEIYAEAKVHRYKVDVIELDENGNEVNTTSYVFDGEGNQISLDKTVQRSKNRYNDLTLRIFDLNPQTKYKLEVKGYTADQSLVYNDQNTVTTGIMSGVEDVEISQLEITGIYNLRGEYLGCDPNSLKIGVYIIKTPSKTYKIAIN